MRRSLLHLPLWRDALVVALIAVVTVQGLRRFYGDRYLVPSDSMQPMLYGDPLHGDVVFVDKLARAADRRRGDVVVVERPGEIGQQLVKRIAARGDDADACWIDIRDGDVWLGPDSQHLSIEVKEPAAALARAVPWGEVPGPASGARVIDLGAATGEGPWLLPPTSAVLGEAVSAFSRDAQRVRHRDPSAGVLPRAAVGTRRPVDCTYVDANGSRSVAGEDVPVVDCWMQVEFDAPGATLLCSIDDSTSIATFAWRVGAGEVEVLLDGDVVGRHSIAAPSACSAVAFGRLDGRDFLMVDGATVLAVPTPGAARRGRTRTWLFLGVVGSEPATLQHVHVARDVYHYRQPALGVPGQPNSWPRFVGPGQWFLLGDNAFDSRDSRQFGPVPASSFLGVPRCVLGPWPRRRMLGP